MRVSRSYIRLSEVFQKLSEHSKDFESGLGRLSQRFSRMNHERKEMMIGTWDIRVTLRDCQSGCPIKTFRAINTFGCGGTLIETGARDESRLCSPGQGTWRHIGGQNFCAILWSLHSNRNGAIAERRKVKRQIELSGEGTWFTAT